MVMLPISNTPNHENNYISLTVIRAKATLAVDIWRLKQKLVRSLVSQEGLHKLEMESAWPAGMTSSLSTTSAATAALNQEQTSLPYSATGGQKPVLSNLRLLS